MGEEPDSQNPDQRSRSTAGDYWSTPADDSAAQPTGVATVVATDVLGPSDPLGTPPVPHRPPTAALGWVALGLAAVCIVAEVMAIVVATQRYWDAAVAIAQVTNVATVVVFVVGLFAAFRRPARWLGIGAMVIAVVVNPFILTHLLAYLGGS